MPVGCSQARRQMPVAIDQELTPTQQEEFERHLAGCPVCRREFQRLERTVSLLERLPSPEPSARFNAAVMARIKSAKPVVAAPQSKHVGWTMSLLATAAALCVVVGWNEWALPTLIFVVSKGWVVFSTAQSVLMPLAPLGTTTLTVGRSIGGVALALARNNFDALLFSYLMTIAVVLMSAFLPSKRRLAGVFA